METLAVLLILSALEFSVVGALAPGGSLKANSPGISSIRSPLFHSPIGSSFGIPVKIFGFVVVSEGHYDHEHHTHTHGHEHEEDPTPQFATENTTTKVFLGSTARLDCTVDDITNESVSWLRRVDDVLELLTWETHTYSKDKRYSLVHESSENGQSWQLVISNVQTNDAGQYSCQVSTQPPMVLNAQLQVTEPRVRVVDERGTKVVDKHYNSGSMIELKCVIEFVPFPHGPVIWKRGNTSLAFNTSNGGISVKGDPDSGYIRSRLYVANATPRHAGVYSCWYSNYSSDTVTVHVIAGENSAGLHHDAVPGGEEEGTKEVSSGAISIFQSYFQSIGSPTWGPRISSARSPTVRGPTARAPSARRPLARGPLAWDPSIRGPSPLPLEPASWPGDIWNDSWFDEPLAGWVAICRCQIACWLSWGFLCLIYTAIGACVTASFFR